MVDEQVASVLLLCLVFLLNSLSCGFGLFEADVAEVFVLTIVVASLDVSGCDLSKLAKHLLELLVVSSGGKVLDEDVVECVAVACLALLAFLMVEGLDLLAVEFESSACLDGFFGGVSIFKLNVAKTAGFAVWIRFQFAGLDGSELGEGIEQRLLVDLQVDVADEHVGLWVKDSAFLEGGADCRAINLLVVDAVGTTFGFGGVKELEEAVAVLALGLLVGSDDSLEDVVPQ